MGVKQIITDDLTGDELPDGTQPVNVTFNGTKYSLYLSDESQETFVALLTGEAPLLATAKPAKASKKAATQSSGIDNYGFEAKEVRQFAIAEKMKSSNGKPISNAGKLPQSAYDAFKAAQTKK